MGEQLGTIATIASIGAVIVSFCWFVVRVWRDRQELKRLERHLRSEKAAPRFDGDNGKRSVNHLMRELAMSEDKVLRLSGKSARIRRSSRKRKDGMSGEVLFEFVEETE